MVKFEKALMEVYKKTLNNTDITKLLYYPSTSFADDPLGKADLTVQVASKYIKKIPSDYIIDVISDDTDPVKRGYITVFMDDYNKMDNPYASAPSIRIEIYMPIRDFEEYQYRTAAIVRILNNIFMQKQIEGSLGKLILDSSYNISRPADGYMGYAHIFSAGDMISGL